MNREDLIIGVHGRSDLQGGHYNVLSSFTKGLIDGFNHIGIKAYTIQDCQEKKLFPSLTIGFNVAGFDYWQEFLKRNITNIMWSVDSIFAQNYGVMKQFAQDLNFVLFSVTPCDFEPISEYYPLLKNAYLPHATDLDMWKKQDVSKDFDIVLFSSIKDYEQQLAELKESVGEPVFKIMMEMYNISLENPNLPFWDIYKIFQKHSGLSLYADEYAAFFSSLSYIIMNVKKVQAVQNLSDFNLKIFGDGPWEKYISGKNEYLGACDVLESIDIMNRAKIVLHPHGMQLSSGVHERILNASAVETFVLSSDALSIKNEFGENLGYYNNATFEDIADKANYYLLNTNERTEKAKNSRKIVAERFTWKNRAQEIVSLIDLQ